MQFLKIILSLALISLTASCSYIYGDQGVIRNRNTAYLKATSVPPLKMPPGLSSSTFEAHYPVSDANYPNTDKEIDLTPPNLISTGK